MVKVGVSACLLGQAVRYDGGDKRNHFVVEELARLVELVPVCPEVEVGMGVPRPPLHLVRPARLVVATTGEDWTARMERFARDRVGRLAAAGISGYVLKARSPSCGLDGVELHDAAGATTTTTTREGRGLFAAELRRALPELPIEEESGLEDRQRRQAFVEKVFAYRRLQRR